MKKRSIIILVIGSLVTVFFGIVLFYPIFDSDVNTTGNPIEGVMAFVVMICLVLATFIAYYWFENAGDYSR